MASDSLQSEVERRKQSKKTYERIIGIVDAQTSKAQRPLSPKSQIYQVCSMSNIPLEDGNRALQAAIANDDVFDWHGEVCVCDEESLLRVIEWEVNREIMRKLLIAKCNQKLAEIRGDRDD